MDIDKALVKQVNPKLTHIDDLNIKCRPEDVPGCIGYRRKKVEVTAAKADKYEFRVNWYFPPNFYKPGGHDKDMLENFINIINAPLIITVNGRQSENMALDPPRLYP